MEKQVNVRLSAMQLAAIDRKRIELQPQMGVIPTRSDILRFALEAYLSAGLDVSSSKLGEQTQCKESVGIAQK
jgi:hypothetical protein